MWKSMGSQRVRHESATEQQFVQDRIDLSPKCTPMCFVTRDEFILQRKGKKRKKQSQLFLKEI